MSGISTRAISKSRKPSSSFSGKIVNIQITVTPVSSSAELREARDFTSFQVTLDNRGRTQHEFVLLKISVT